MSNKKINKLVTEADARRKAFEAKQTERELKAVRRKKDNRLALVIGAAAIVVALAASLSHENVTNAAKAEASASASAAAAAASASPSATSSAAVPDKSIAEDRTWTGTMMINHYMVDISLDGKKAPQAVANFVALSKKGFFNGVSCHRLTTAGIFVLQCGDPTGTGTGGPGYSFGPIENAPSDAMYKTGVLAMARQGGKGDSMGSQFFIVYKDSTIPADAAGGYTVFGEVTTGINKIQKIAAAGVSGGGSDGAPATPTAVTRVSVK